MRENFKNHYPNRTTFIFLYFLSNSSFRSELEKHDKNLFQRIWEAISGVIKEFFGKNNNRLPKDLLEL